MTCRACRQGACEDCQTLGLDCPCCGTSPSAEAAREMEEES